MKKPNKILHITPHLGGGVGKVIINYLKAVNTNPEFAHKIISLEYANDMAKDAALCYGFEIKDNMSFHHKKILSEISNNDIILIHWWNHPLLYNFLIKEELPYARIIFWSHISGNYAPNTFSSNVLNYPDLFVFTTPMSYESETVKKLNDDVLKKMRVIWSTGGIEKYRDLNRKPHSSFNIGYVGTVDYSKLHPAFLQMCGKILIENIRFIVCGGPCERKIESEAKELGINNRFTFYGQVNNPEDYFREFDVFGYPLAPYHYGTCEQALCESMAAGVPPVVLANKAESYIVDNRVTGIIAENELSYINAVKELYLKPELLKELSVNARVAAENKFSMNKMISDWEQTFYDILKFNKKPRKWGGSYSGMNTLPYQIFLESVCGYAEEFSLSVSSGNHNLKKMAEDSIRALTGKSPLWHSETKGTPNHYLKFFPEDKILQYWCMLIKQKI